MSNQKAKKQHKPKKKPLHARAGTLAEEVRQGFFPSAIRIERSADSDNTLPQREKIAEPPTRVVSDAKDKYDRLITQLVETELLVAELATCLWYIKVKYFKKSWDDAENIDDDPRVRRTLGRISKSMELFKKCGFELKDPTNDRYVQGNGGAIEPIELVPTAGQGFEKISETVTPLIWHGERRLQKAKVFVAVPEIGVSPSPTPASSDETPRILEGLPSPASPGAPVSGIPKPLEKSNPEGAEIQVSNNREDSGGHNKTTDGGEGRNPSGNS